MRSFCFVVFITSFVFGIVGSAVGQRTTHPLEKNIPLPETKMGEIGRFQGSEIPTRVDSISRRLGSLEEVTDTEGSVIGRVADVVQSKRRIYVLDDRVNEVKVYSKTGKRLKTIGEAGRGPQELERPSSLFLTNDGKLGIVDMSHVDIFNLNKGKYEKKGISPSDARGSCTMNGMIFTTNFVANKKTKRINTMSLKGDDPAEQFGWAYKAEGQVGRILRAQISNSIIECIPGRGEVISSFRTLPYVESYTDDGERRWTSKIITYESLNFVSDKGVTPKFKSTHNYTVSLSRIDDEFSLLQVAKRNGDTFESGGGSKYKSVQSYVVNNETGKGFFISDRLPVLQDVGDEYALSARNYPKPSLTIYQFK